MMMSNEWGFHTSPAIKEAVEKGGIVILPIGSTEQHGPFLPVNTDAAITWAIAMAAAKRVSDKLRVLVAPLMPYGYSPHHCAFPGTITLSAPTMQQVIIEIVESIRANGFEKIVLLNGHGGNMPLLRTVVSFLSFERGIKAVLVTYWRLIADVISEIRESEPGGMGHAGELETSLQLYLNEEYVDKEKIRSEIPQRKSEFYQRGMFSKSKVFYPLALDEISALGVIGAASLANKEKGRKIFELIVNELARFLIEFATWTD